MRLVMLGTGPFAVPTLRALAASEHDMLCAVSRPPRGRQPHASPLQRAASELGMEVWSPESINQPDSQARLAALEADLLVVCDYGEILRPATLAATRLGGINLHGSLLPKYRGAAPVQWAILNGEIETGVSVIQMTPGLDAGPCLAQQRAPIDANEDAEQLEARLAKMGADLVAQVVDQLVTGTAQPIEQDALLASKAPRLTKEHGAIDWSGSALEIKNQVRALRPWPRAYTYWHGAGGPPVRLAIDHTAIAAMESTALENQPLTAPPGTVMLAASRLIIATGHGALEILELQPAGKRSMAATDFLRGNRVEAGDRLGPE
jgi:methionyl-tRNA formyltransferase